jgi:hypothetical protein
MATKTGVGWSVARDPGAAGRQAGAEACAALGGGTPDFCLTFATTGYHQDEVLGASARSWGGRAWQAAPPKG